MDWEQKTIVNELAQGKELAEQLRNQVNSISSPETRQFLVEQILLSYEKALSMLNWGASATETKPTISTLESPHSYANSSPRSEVSDQDCKVQCHRDVYKKRKTQPRWTEQVKIPGDDGYNWRKYGQKEILGANFPRGYYRCTHRHSQGCLATKQVQRSDQDPTVFEVTYRGRHTCFQSPRLAVGSASSHKNDKSKQDNDNYRLQQHELELEHKHEHEHEHEEKPKPKAELLKEISFNYRDGLKMEELDIFPSFSFPDASYIGYENDIFKECLASPAGFIISPSTSESNYFSMSPCHYNNVRTPESDSLPTSVANSPTGDWGISIDNGDFDTSFPLDDKFGN